MAQPSGAAWCAQFHESRSLDDLGPTFAPKAKAFIAALTIFLRVTINATYRPVERAYLMHWSWMIARLRFDPADVPPMAGVDIEWNHDDAVEAAEDMVKTYGIVYEPALASRHTQRLAMDLSISWEGNLDVIDNNGVRHFVNTSPRDGTNAVLAQIGQTFGVIKNHKDRPHWSIDGR